VLVWRQDGGADSLLHRVDSLNNLTHKLEPSRQDSPLQALIPIFTNPDKWGHSVSLVAKVAEDNLQPVEDYLPEVPLLLLAGHPLGCREVPMLPKEQAVIF